MRQSGLRKKGNAPPPPYVPYEKLRGTEVVCRYQKKDKEKWNPPTTVFGLDMSGAGLNFFKLSPTFVTITELYLQKNSLRHVPPAIGDLSQLQVLDLSYNSLEGLPLEMGSLFELRELDLSCNRLTELSMDVFGRLCKLLSCKLDGNNITNPPLHIQQGGAYPIFRYCCDNMGSTTPPDRVLRHFVSEEEQSRLEAAGHVKISVTCYNVLAELYATPERHPYCASWALAWSYRKMRILQEILFLNSDVVCLQEVETGQYREFFAPNMSQAGYEGIFQPKSRARTMGDGSRVDGCAIFWKHSMFGLVEEHVIEFQNEAAQRTEEFAGDGLNRLILKDNIALLAMLEMWSTRQRVLVANTHIHWDPQFSDVKLVQTKMFLEKLASLRAQNASLPVIISGDFNSTPDSGVYTLVSTGKLSPNHPELRNHSYGEYSKNGMHHALELVSCYPPSSTPYTNCTHEFKGVLDYIFVTSDSLRVASILNPIALENLPLPALPNSYHPSDHIALFVNLIF